MDIISHSLTGLAVGTVCAHFSKDTWRKKCLILFTSTLGGALPDLDAISLWSGFDSSLGQFFNLNANGRQIYYGKYWYSHHAAFHSLIAPLTLIILSMLPARIYSMFTRDPTMTIDHTSSNTLLIKLGFFLGFTFHLLEDMPTPAGVWGGVNLLFPSSEYIGGFGKIWWWNNYDLLLIIFSVIVINFSLFFMPKRYRQVKSGLSLSIFCIGLCLYLLQINTRPIDFNYIGRLSKAQHFESQSLTIQRDILGDDLYQLMVSIDKKIPIPF